jgi:hypothetical protein
MNYIYLIGPPGGGAARTRSETMAAAFEQASGYQRCTQEKYLQRMREIRALDIPSDSIDDTDLCQECGTPMEWEDCNVCGGEGFIDGGWWTCPCLHIYPTETDRTASDPASDTPAGTPAPPLAGRQQPRQRKDAL